MNILVIGNGFDRVHKLPTRYTDFLRYCREYKEDNPISKYAEMNDEFLSFINENIWLKYFIEITPNLDDDLTWIDFENEVSNVVRFFESGNISLRPAKFGGLVGYSFISAKDVPMEKRLLKSVEPLISSFFDNGNDSPYVYTLTDNRVIDIKHMISFISTHLKLFARAFEIYCLMVNNVLISNPPIITSFKSEVDFLRKESYRLLSVMDNSSVSSYERLDAEIKYEMVSSKFRQISPIDYFAFPLFDCVLSFNYTNTFERLYGNDKTQYCYIHGKAQSDATKTNIIFGIDDGLRDGDESKNFKWVNFKKYYQRIILKTSSTYKDWLSSSSLQEGKNFVHIVGHSLDKTDHEVLYEIFTNEKFNIIIYYYNDNDFEEKVQKTMELLSYRGKNGRDELISRVHGSQRTIKFSYLYDADEGLFLNI